MSGQRKSQRIKCIIFLLLSWFIFGVFFSANVLAASAENINEIASLQVPGNEKGMLAYSAGQQKLYALNGNSLSVIQTDNLGSGSLQLSGTTDLSTTLADKGNIQSADLSVNNAGTVVIAYAYNDKSGGLILTIEQSKITCYPVEIIPSCVTIANEENTILVVNADKTQVVAIKDGTDTTMSYNMLSSSEKASVEQKMNWDCRICLLDMGETSAIAFYGSGKVSVYALGASRETEITILYTGNLYGNLISCKDENIGVDLAATMKNALPNTVLLDTGDAFAEGDDITSEITLMNLAGYDVMSAGKSDFATGQLMDVARLAEFPILSANIANLEGDAFLSDVAYGQDNQINNGSWTIVEREGVKIGIFGISDIDTTGDGVQVKPLLSTAEEAVAALKEKGADVIICLSSAGTESSQEIANKIGKTDGLDIIIDSSEDILNTPESINGVMIQSSGEKGNAIGRIDIKVKDHQISLTSSMLTAEEAHDSWSPDETIVKAAEELASANNSISEGTVETAQNESGAQAQTSVETSVSVSEEQSTRVYLSDAIGTALMQETGSTNPLTGNTMVYGDYGVYGALSAGVALVVVVIILAICCIYSWRKRKSK